MSSMQWRAVKRCEVEETPDVSAEGEARAFPSSPEAITRWLSERVGRMVQLVFTNNRVTMMSYREIRGGLKLRLHRMFLEAPPIVWEALAEYLICGQRDAGRVIDAFIEARSADYKKPSRQLRPVGRVHHLAEIFSELNREFFHDSCRARISWGTARSGRRRRSIQLGSFCPDEKLIRLHPCLDQEFVPQDYVRWVVFHEMLHEVLGVEKVGGRRRVHPPEFVAIEETFPGYRRCKRWEEKNLDRLLAFRPDLSG